MYDLKLEYKKLVKNKVIFLKTYYEYIIKKSYSNDINTDSIYYIKSKINDYLKKLDTKLEIEEIEKYFK